MGDLGLYDRNSSRASWPAEHQDLCTLSISKSDGLHSLRVAFVIWVTLKEGLGFGKGTRVELKQEVGQVFSRGRR